MKSKIYIKQWLSLKPQNYSGRTDLYYLKIANSIRESLGEMELMMLSQFLEDEDVNELCCFLTCYFEDIISDANIWGAFKSEYAKLYNKKLPFFILDDHYIDEEINIEDVTFLIWYYINALQEEMFLSPYNQVLFDIAELAMSIFDKEYEYAPENIKLKTYYNFEVSSKEEAFYETRTFIQPVFFETYLFQPDIKRRLDDAVFILIEDNKEEGGDLIMSMMREVTEDFAFNQRSKLLALSAKEWTNAFLGDSSKESSAICSLSRKIKGFFLFKSHDKNSVYFEHIASGMQFKMTKKSFDHATTLDKDDIVYIGMVNYNEEWWFSGNFVKKPFDADFILDEKNSAESRAEVNFLMDKQETGAILEKQKKAFLAYNNNSLIAFVPTSKLENFTNGFMHFFNESLGLSDAEIPAAENRARADGYFGSKNSFEEFEEEATIVFFNVNQGIEFYVDVIGAFPDERNPFFVEEIKEDVTHILMADNCSTEIAHFMIDNYKDKLDYFKNDPYKSYLEDLDFLLRFWKTSNYFTESNLVLTGSKKIE